MKEKIILLIIFLFCEFVANAQLTDSIRIATLEHQNKSLQDKILKSEQRIQELATQVASNSEKVNLLGEAIDQKIGGLHEQMDSIDERYGVRMTDAETAVQEAGNRQHKSVVWGIVIAAAICLLLVAAYFILRKRIAKKGDDIEMLRARADDLNRQMIERMDKELVELQKIVSTISTPLPMENTIANSNHDIVLAVGDNLAIMESNLYRMDSTTPGYRTLTNAVKKMKNNLLQKGYDFVNMLGTEYVDGMNVDKVVFKDDDNIEEGKQIITAVRRPQINYNGKAIQLANIEVSQNI